MQDPPEPMGKRGMLPKFRPAALGRDAQARPSIRPVRPSPPPPPPSPPRRNPSGFGPRGGAAAAESSRHDDEHERSTAQGHDEPATVDRLEGGLESIPREPPNARRGRADAISISFEDETQARPVDHSLLDKLRNAGAPGVPGAPGAPAQVPADLGVDYESLPSLEVRRPYDTYEAEFSERDPVTQLHAHHAHAPAQRAQNAQHAQHESAQVRRSDKAPYREASYDEASYDEASYEPSFPAPVPAPATERFGGAQNDDGWGRREESGPRERPVPDARAYAAPAPSYDDVSDSARWARDQGAQPPSTWSNVPAASDSFDAQPMIPPAPRVPDEIHPAFVHGVQPIRTATPDAWGTPHARNTPVPQAPMASPMQPMHSSMPPAYAQQAHYGQQLQHQPQPTHYAAAPYAPAHAQMPPQHGGYAHAQQGSYPAPAYAGHSAAPPPMHAGASGQMPSASPSMMNRAQPVGAQIADAPEGASKVGRFAWFVAGAAFGITFAFFATGFFTGGKQSEFPAAPPLPPAVTAPAATALAPTAPVVAPGAPAAVAPAVAPPAVTAPVTAPAPTAPPVAAALAAPPVAAPPVAAPAAPPAAAAPVAAAPVAKAAPPPRAPRVQAPPPRRPAPPPAAPQGPKNLGGGGPGADDEPRSPAPSAPSGGGDISDLLGAGLKP